MLHSLQEKTFKMSDSRNSSRKNTENDSSIEVVQIDGLVIMKLIKHCHELEASASGSGIAQGALLGEITLINKE